MPLRTGIDIVDVGRIRRLLSKYGSDFTEKYFTEAERQHADASPDPEHWYAAYWAIREAAFKIGQGSLWRHYSTSPGADSLELILDDRLFESGDCSIPPGADWSSSTTRNDQRVVATVLTRWSDGATERL